MGAALITPTSLSIVTLTFPEEKRGVAIAIWSGIVGFGIGLGPLAGGLLSEYVDWRWVFFINVPIGAIAVVGAFVWVRESRSPTQERRLDVVGLLLSAVGFFSLTFALLQANEFGWGDLRTLLLFAGGFLALLAFVLVERRVRVPLLDLSLFRSPTFSGANATAIFVGFSLFGLLFFGSIFTQNVMGYSAVESGASLLPMMVLIMLLAPVVGKLTDRLGPRWLLSGGMGVLAIALVSFSRLEIGSDFWDLLPGMLIGGLGFSLVLTPLTTAALAGVPIANAGMGAAVINATRQIGGLLGLAVMGAISAAEIERSLREGNAGVESFVDSFRTLMLIGAAVSVLGAIVAALTVTRGAVAPPEAEPAPDRLRVRTTNTWAVATPSVTAALAQAIPRESPGVLIVAGRESGTFIPVTPEPFVFGRAEEAPGKLGGDPELSRRHASVSVLDPGRLLVEDLSSTNGTFVNGHRIAAPTIVRPGDSVRLGTTTLEIVNADGAET